MGFDRGKLNLFDETGAPNLFRTWRSPIAVAAAAASFVHPDDEVLAVAAGGAVRAYPVRLIAAHHIVEDDVAGRPVLVTF